MKYEIVNLAEKTVIGLSARTNNTSPDMQQVIGGLWNRFFQEGIYAKIPGKINEKALGIYTDYAGMEMDDYTLIVACETDGQGGIPEGTIRRTIPQGKYAKFIVTGDMSKSVSQFWEKLWEMNLPRSFESDFEEYQDDNMENAEIHIYIGLKTNE